jgi:type VI secretion system protein ImpA
MINLDKILQPISAEKPCGADLREDISANSLYYKIKDARNLARDLERQQSMGEMARDNKPRWDKLLTLCIEALEKHSKDLEIVSWMIEALIREEGFDGLNKGFNIANQLIEW